MADIISMEHKRRASGTALSADVQRKRRHAVRSLLQCAGCRLKCEKCGNRIVPADRAMDAAFRLRVPYRFCRDCGEEYIDYIDRLTGGGDAACYWRNASWLASWRSWIEYRSVSDQHLRSKELTLLMREMQETTANE